MSMKFKQGEFVRIIAGPYEGEEGVIEDVQPECSAVRIGTREGNAFAMLDDLKAIPPIAPQLVTGKPALRRK